MSFLLHCFQMLSIVTWNLWKYQQIKAFLPPIIETKQLAIDLIEIQTTSLEEISAYKCMQAYTHVQWPVLVDDSGICFDAFHGFPGALSRYFYEGVWISGMERLFTDIENRNAQFQCVLSYMDDSLATPMQFIGTVEGRIDFWWVCDATENPKLPYDLIFIPEGMDRPAFFDEEMWNDQYNHRVRAVKKFGERLNRKKTL